MTFPAMPAEADALFGKLERSPFKTGSVDAVTGQANEIPLEPVGPAQDIKFPRALWGLIDSGVANGDFAEGPEDDDVDIDDVENKLPNWSIRTVSGTSMSIQRTADAAARSGFSLEFTATSAVATDEIYLEQVVPIQSNIRYVRPLAVGIQAGGFEPALDLQLRSQFLKEDLTTTGSETSTSVFGVSLAEHSVWHVRRPPADAMFMRLRLRWIASGNVASYTAHIRFVGAKMPQLHYVTLFGGRTASFTAGTTDDIYMLDDGIVAGVNQFLAPMDGWVQSLSARIDDPRTAGTLTFRVHDLTLAADITEGQCVIDGSFTQGRVQTQNLDGRTVPDFFSFDRLRLVGVSSGAFAPVTANAVVTAVLAMYEPDI